MALALAISRRTFVGVFLVLILTIFSVLGFVYLPSATIVIHPELTDRSITREILLSQTATEPDFAHFILPAKVVQKEVAAQKTIERAGVTPHDDFAQGSITLHNDQEEEQSLLPKTHLRHEQSGVFFLTNQAVHIPPQGTVQVGVTAEEKGAAGNVPPGRFIVDRLPISLQKTVFGVSDVPFTGGTVVDTPLSQAEIDAAHTQVLEQAKAQASGQLTAASGGAVIRPELLTIATKDENISATAGSLTSSFSIQATVQASGFIVDDNDLLSLTLLALRNQTAQDENFVSYDPKSFSVSITAADFSAGTARVTGKLTGQFAHTIAPTAVDVQPLVGLSADEIKDRLKKFPGIGDVEVRFSPFWVTSAPSRLESLHVLVQGVSSPAVSP